MKTQKYDKEKYRKLQEERLKSVDAQIKEVAESFSENAEVLAEFVAFGARFYKYSVNNLKLIYSQNRGATFVASFNDWKNKGYSVNRGEHGLNVLVPVTITYVQDKGNWIKISQASREMKEKVKAGLLSTKCKLAYKLGSVFDISQTNVPIEEYPQYFSMGKNDEELKEICDHLIAFLKNEGMDVDVETLKSLGLRGLYSEMDNQIVLNSLLRDTQRTSTLTHEIGHWELGHGSLCKKSEMQMELEADCFSIMYSSWLGIEVTDTRKRHLQRCYNAFLDHTKENKEEAFQTVFRFVQNHFQEHIQAFSEYQMVKSMDIVEKGKTR